MGYNASYGLPCNDSMTTYEIKKKDGETECFLESDCQGNLYIKKEFLFCAKCGTKIEQYETTYIHGNKQLCGKCEKLHRMTVRRNQLKNRNNNMKKVVKK